MRRGVEGAECVEIAAHLIALAFAGPSENAVCQRASEHLGIAENTVRALVRKQTKKPSFELIMMLCGYCVATGKDPMQVHGVKAFVDLILGGK